jgi:3-oxoacyl-[acyl-carrier protein] reductase
VEELAMSDGSRPVAVVTGASSGIGAAAAGEFARRGYDLALCADTGPLDDVAAAARALGGRAAAITGDLADLAFCERLIARAADEFGRVDVLVNNAAWRETVTMRQITVESWERTLRVCVTAPAFLARWAAVHMEQRGHGVIVNVGSIMADRPAGTAPAYVAAKGALDSLTYELAALYGPAGVRAVGVAPGAVDTAIAPGHRGSDPDPAAGELREWTQDVIPLRRWATPAEIASAIAWLASDGASYISGTTLVVDGGWSRHLHPYSAQRRLHPGQF